MTGGALDIHRSDRVQTSNDNLRRQLARFRVLDRLFKGKAGMLSGGEQQQLVIAHALMARPRVLLLDEPSLGLSPMTVDHVLDAVARKAKRQVDLSRRGRRTGSASRGEQIVGGRSS